MFTKANKNIDVMKIKYKVLPIILILITSQLTANHDPATDRYSIDIECLKKVPIVKATLNGKTAYFIVDSGSDVSLLHKSDASDYAFTPKKRATKSIIGVSGGNQSLYEAPDIDLKMAGHRLQTQFYATDLSTVVKALFISTGIAVSGIIGIDLMRKYGFEIDYVNEKLFLDTDY